MATITKTKTTDKSKADTHPTEPKKCLMEWEVYEKEQVSHGVTLSGGCPIDSFSSTSRCGQRSPIRPSVCTRPRGHTGEHHAHSSNGHCLGTWVTPQQSVSSCPLDADGTPAHMACHRQSGSGNICTRTAGHTGEHHAHSLIVNPSMPMHCYESWAEPTPTQAANAPPCPGDVTNGVADGSCGVYDSGHDFVCTRMRGHIGQHHGHSIVGTCVGNWADMQPNEPATQPSPAAVVVDEAPISERERAEAITEFRRLLARTAARLAAAGHEAITPSPAEVAEVAAARARIRRAGRQERAAAARQPRNTITRRRTR